MMIKKLIIGLLLIGLIVGAYGYFFMYHKAHPDYENLNAEIKISAQELFYQCKNENKSGEYTGKILEISGTAQAIENNDDLMTLVFEFEEGMFGTEGVRVTFLPQYSQDIKDMNLNSEIILKAYCTGYNETDVVLEKASFIN